MFLHESVCTYLWTLYSRTLCRKLKVAYTNIFRFLFCIKRGESISAAIVRANINDTVLRKDNNLVKTIVQSAYYILAQCLKSA